MSKSKDENDRLREGTLPKDPRDDARPVDTMAETRKATLRLVGNAPDADRGAPHDVHAEFALLAALLWCGANAPKALSVTQIRDVLEQPEMFFSPQHQKVFAAILAVADANTPPDPVAVHSELVRRREERVAGGLAYLDQLVAGATATNEAKARAYAKAIRETYTRRQLIATAQQIDELARSGKVTAAEAADQAQAVLVEATRAASSDGSFVHIKDCFYGLVKALHNKESPGQPTGFRELDKATGGLFPNETTVIGARTSVGKSVMATQISIHVAQAGVGVLYASLEMKAGLFATRLAAGQAHVDASRIRRHEASPDEVRRVVTAAAEMAKLPLYFVDSQQQTMMSVYRIARKLSQTLTAKGMRLGLVVIDHIGLVKPTAEALKKASREQQVAETSRGLRVIAEDFGCHVIAISQINREAAKRKGDDACPTLHDLKESGSIENDADNVILIHREKDNYGQFVHDKPARIILAKSRSDSLSTWEMGFEARYAKFIDLADDGLPREESEQAYDGDPFAGSAGDEF